MNARTEYQLLIAIYPNTRGFAFVVFEGPLAPIDWGVKEVRSVHRNRECLRHVSAIIDRYEPSVIVLQDSTESGTRRAPRVRVLNASIAELIDKRGIHAAFYSRARVRTVFGHLGNPTKHSLAHEIAKHVPVFERYLPPIRKPWMSEDARMGLFDAAALALVHFQLKLDTDVYPRVRAH